jgi:hypothetical protein
MGRQVRRALGLAAAVLLLLAAAALAAGPKKGATYAGTTVHGMDSITLKVSKNGKTVTVNAPFAPLYCQGGGGPTRQVTKSAAIAKNGSFSGSIAYESVSTHTRSTKLYFKGRFAGKLVTGTVRSEFGIGGSPEARASLKQCEGSTSFSAKTK